MMKIIGRLRIFRAPYAPTVAMSATATREEITSTSATLGFRVAPVILETPPTQSHIKYVTIERPSNNNGPDGYIDKKGEKYPGYLDLLLRIYLD